MTGVLTDETPAAGGSAGQPGETRREVLGMASGGSLNLLGAAISQIATFAVVLVLARALGKDDVGLYAQAYAFLSLLNLLALSGLRSGLTRFVAVHRADGNDAALRGVVRLGMSLTSIGAVVFAGLLLLLAPWLVHSYFSDPRLVEPLRLVAAALVFQTVTDSALGATQGFKTMRYFAGIGLICEPVLRIAITAALLSAGMGIRGAMIALIVSNAVACTLALRALRALLGRRRVTPTYNLRELFGFSTVSWLGSIASTGLIWAGTIMLGALSTSEQVGAYSVATRLVTLATFVMPPINASFAPRIADLFHRGRTDPLRRIYGVATSWILRLSLPAFIALIVLPRDLLGLFGRDFRTAALCTLILACGKLVDAGTGPCALMLNMSGRPILNTIDNVGVLVLNITLNLYLIPRHGIIGAALAWAISLWLVNVARVVQVWVVMRMLPFDVGLLKGLAAADAALLATTLLGHVVGAPWRLPLGLGVLGTVYFGTIAALGLSSEDRLVARMLLRRTRGEPRDGAGSPAPA